MTVKRLARSYLWKNALSKQAKRVHYLFMRHAGVMQTKAEVIETYGLLVTHDLFDTILRCANDEAVLTEFLDRL